MPNQSNVVQRGFDVSATAAEAWPRAEKVLLKILPLILIILIAYLLAKLTWLLIPEPQQKAAPPVVSTSLTVSQQSENKVDINGLVKRNLFGKAEVAVVKAEPKKVTNAPETKLKIKLAGVILASIPENSRALIEVTKGKQKVFSINDEITNGTELKEIHPEHVVLERNGRFETLRIQKVSPKKATASNSSFNSRNTRALGAGMGQSLAKVRQELMSDPSKAGDYIRVRPVNGKTPGEFKGYRIYPGKNRKLFRQAGLRSGDLVKGVNGIMLDSPDKGFSLIAQLPTASSVTLDVERRGKLETITVNLDQ